MSILTDSLVFHNDEHRRMYEEVKKLEPVKIPYGEELFDADPKSGRVKPWTIHKTSSMLLSESLERIGKDRKAESVRYCGSLLKFNVCPHGHEKKLTWANFCRVRLCPMCSWRKSLLQSHTVKKVAHVAASNHKCRWLMLTLTWKNVKGEHLAESISQGMKAWNNLIRRKKIKGTLLGFFRSLEITVNNKTNEYHPHFHVLLCVTPSYFTRGYIKQAEWAELWAESLKVDYTPSVHIETLKSKRSKEAEQMVLQEMGIELNDGLLTERALNEVTKYVTKSSDYIIPDDKPRTDEIVATLESAVNHTRLYAFGGILKDIYEYLKQQEGLVDPDDETANLINVTAEDNCSCSVCQSDMLERLYRWLPSRQGYFETKIIEQPLLKLAADDDDI